MNIEQFYDGSIRIVSKSSIGNRNTILTFQQLLDLFQEDLFELDFNNEILRLYYGLTE